MRHHGRMGMGLGLAALAVLGSASRTGGVQAVTNPDVKDSAKYSVCSEAAYGGLYTDLRVHNRAQRTSFTAYRLNGTPDHPINIEACTTLGQMFNLIYPMIFDSLTAGDSRSGYDVERFIKYLFLQEWNPDIWSKMIGHYAEILADGEDPEDHASMYAKTYDSWLRKNRKESPQELLREARRSNGECELCGRRIKTASGFKRHMDSYHNGKT